MALRMLFRRFYADVVKANAEVLLEKSLGPALPTLANGLGPQSASPRDSGSLLEPLMLYCRKSKSLSVRRVFDVSLIPTPGKYNNLASIYCKTTTTNSRFTELFLSNPEDVGHVNMASHVTPILLHAVNWQRFHRN
jgi:hypothetical protein